MKFEIRRVVKVLELSEYAPEYEGTTIMVWVNPPARLLQEHDRILSDITDALKNALVEGFSPEKVIERAAEELVAVFAELWSQGAAEMQWTADEVTKLVADTQDSDPQLWLWLRTQTINAIREHRERIKKG